MSSLIPFWSFLELLIFLDIFLLSSMLFSKINDSDIQSLIYIFSLVQLLYIIRIFLNYTFTIIDGQKIDSYIIIDGFSNIRFYAQFLSWTVPFITAYLALEKKNKFDDLIISILSISWALAFFSGTRSFLLGIIASLVIVFFLTPSLWGKYLKKTIRIGLVGFIIYLIMTLLIPYLLKLDNVNILNSTINRDFTSSSGRVEIWMSTWEVALKYPYLGLGPMMTAADDILPVAHPHNFLLQLAAEWGLIFASIVILTTGYCIWLWQRAIKQKPLVRAPLALPVTASISSAVCVSLVDGVMVMPVSLMYFCVIVGAAAALLRTWSPDLKNLRLSMLSSVILLTPIALLLFITINQWLHLAESNQKNHPSPRFWANGKLQQHHYKTLLDLFNSK